MFFINLTGKKSTEKYVIKNHHTVIFQRTVLGDDGHKVIPNVHLGITKMIPSQKRSRYGPIPIFDLYPSTTP